MGVDEQRFVVHKSLICASSAFFKAACSGTWKENEEKIVRLPEQLPESFEVYLHMLYTGTFDIWGDDEEALIATCKDTANGKSTNLFNRIISCFVLGDVTRDARFCNRAVDGLIESMNKVNCVPGPTVISKHWDNLPSGCAMRRLLVDCVAHSVSYDHMVERAEQFPQSFITGVALAGVRDRNLALKDKVYARKSKCYYHEHVSDEDRCA